MISNYVLGHYEALVRLLLGRGTTWVLIGALGHCFDEDILARGQL
jgi:hypothetical protein